MHRSSLLPPASWSVNEIVISQSMLPCNGLPNAFSPPFMVLQHTPMEPGKFSQHIAAGTQPEPAKWSCSDMLDYALGENHSSLVQAIVVNSEEKKTIRIVE